MPIAPFYILGVDPGLSGALAVINASTLALVFTEVMPLKRNPMTNKNDMDLDKLNDVLEHIKYSYPPTFIVIEDVKAIGAMPGQHSMSTFRFGYATGAIEAALEFTFSPTPTHFVIPAVWKALMGLGKDKKASIELANSRFPDSLALIGKHDGKAEAALLALFGLESFGKLYEK